MGDPHLGLPGVLIGGTNGKGSVQALVAAALIEAGYRVGQTPKPHLVSYRERILIDGQMISPADFAAIVEETLIAADSVAARHGPPTEFEVLTAAAFTWFRRSGVQVAVVEVGLGGRLDATNVWQGGVSAITNVSLDHMEYLGDTVEAIAAEKAQIIKRGDSAAITGASEPALSVIRSRANRVGVYLEQREPWEVLRMDRTGLYTRTQAGLEYRIGLLGRHQAANAAIAFGVIAAMERDFIIDGSGFHVSREALSRSFANVRWPGRMELISRPGQPDVLLDGAHNPAGMEALGVTLRELLPQISSGSATVLIGALANHWQEGMLDPLIEAVPSAALIATRVPGSPGSLEPATLASAWGAGAATIADADRALGVALQRASQAGVPLVVCGSLYLVGYVRARLMAAGTAG
jgi:dihydrofolate synthase/folylpolyglutamate synthase